MNLVRDKSDQHCEQKARERYNWRLFLGLLVLLTSCSAETVNDEPWDIVPNCKSDLVVENVDSRITNPYFNGYMLTREIFESGENSRITTYEYDSEQHAFIGVTNFNYPVRTTQYLDDNGLLISGIRWQAALQLSSGHSYLVVNNNHGQMQSLERSFGERAEFLYDEDRLTSVNIVDSAGRTDTLAYMYDEESHLVSVYDSDIDLTYYFSCNQKNQITDVYTERDSRRHGRRNIEYDAHGNIRVARRLHADGEEIWTQTYEYEPTDKVVFNHWLMRLGIGLIWPSEDFIH